LQGIAVVFQLGVSELSTNSRVTFIDEAHIQEAMSPTPKENEKYNERYFS
jgi:hypothetical protein